MHQITKTQRAAAWKELPASWHTSESFRVLQARPARQRPPSNTGDPMRLARSIGIMSRCLFLGGFSCGSIVASLCSESFLSAAGVLLFTKYMVDDLVVNPGQSS